MKSQCQCGILINPSQMAAHIAGKKHQQKMASRATASTPAPSFGPRRAQPSVRAPTSILCGLCQVVLVNANAFELHQTMQTHRDRVKQAAPAPRTSQNQRHPRGQQQGRPEGFDFGEAEANKNGVEVSALDGVDFGVVEADPSRRSPTTPSMTLTIRKTDPQVEVLLMKIQFASASRRNTAPTPFNTRLVGQSKWIKWGKLRSLVVSFEPSHEGRHEDILELRFLDIVKKQAFTIIRRIQATVGASDDFEQLKPKAPYVKKDIPRRPREVDEEVVPPPPQWTETQWKNFLPQYPIPAELAEVISQPNQKAALQEIRTRFLNNPFNIGTYARWFHTTLWIEEDQEKQDLGRYSMFGVSLKPDYPRYNLDVDGLAEKRPSVLVGDFIKVKFSDLSDNKWYQGRVYKVHQRSVDVRFADSFSTYRGNKFDVRFVLNRIPMRRAHQALDIRYKYKPTHILFPTTRETAGLRRVTEQQMEGIVLFNRRIAYDREQLETVATILHRPPGAVPFVIFGPPGTGKTITVVESIRQLLHNKPECRILVCAPSNSAADLVAQRLLDLGTAQLFRLNSISREYKTLPTELQPFSAVNTEKVFVTPPAETLGGYRCVVATCISGGIPHGLGIKAGHFTHVFIDECGQAMEPHVMIPIRTLLAPTTTVVLAGDNKQLGPVVRSSLAASLGLKTSYLERLMATEPYDLDTGKGLTIVKLLKNWRSHPDILEFANQQFYDGELEACGDEVITHSLLRAGCLNKKQFPVVFHSCRGRDMREESSPSFFNIDEATLVKKYCIDLTGDKSLQLKPSDIGIISPYHAQCKKILQILPDKLKAIKCSSVEEFQGQERRVIIVSTVRSSVDFIQYDIRHTLGFVANARRFNVAITRARALLIVIGDPEVLGLDPVWRAWLNFVHIGGGWRGRAISWDPQEQIVGQGYDRRARETAQSEAESMLERLRAQIVEGIDEWALPDDEDEGASWVDQPWREDD